MPASETLWKPTVLRAGALPSPAEYAICIAHGVAADPSEVLSPYSLHAPRAADCSLSLVKGLTGVAPVSVLSSAPICLWFKFQLNHQRHL